MPFDWVTVVLTFGFGLIAVILLATLARSIVLALRKRRSGDQPEPVAEGAHEAAELHRREQLESRESNLMPALAQNTSGMAGPG